MIIGDNDDFQGPMTSLTIRTPKQLAKTVEQTSMLSGMIEKIRDEFYSKSIKEGGWTVKPAIGAVRHAC